MKGYPVNALPAAPIRPFLATAIRAAEQIVDQESGRWRQEGQMLLARAFADRYGGNPKNVARQFHRIISGETEVLQHVTADRLATFLGLHLDVLWPKQEEEGQMDRDEARFFHKLLDHGEAEYPQSCTICLEQLRKRRRIKRIRDERTGQPADLFGSDR